MLLFLLLKFTDVVRRRLIAVIAIEFVVLYKEFHHQTPSL